MGIFLALITQAPAQWLAWGVSKISHERLLLKDAQGTIWQGSAQAVLAGGTQDASFNTALPSRLHWTLALGLASWRPHLELRLQSACCTPEPVVAQLLPSTEGVELHINDQQSSWPAQWLTGLGAPWNTIAPQGTLALSTQNLSWFSSTQRLQGKLVLLLQNFSTQLSTIRPLGSYKISLQGGLNPSFELETLEGALQLQGRGEWMHQKVRFQGEAFAREGAESAVSNLLNVLGQRQGNKAILKME